MDAATPGFWCIDTSIAEVLAALNCDDRSVAVEMVEVNGLDRTTLTSSTWFHEPTRLLLSPGLQTHLARERRRREARDERRGWFLGFCPGATAYQADCYLEGARGDRAAAVRAYYRTQDHQIHLQSEPPVAFRTRSRGPPRPA
jgi:hypothetical protein